MKAADSTLVLVDTVVMPGWRFLPAPCASASDARKESDGHRCCRSLESKPCIYYFTCISHQIRHPHAHIGVHATATFFRSGGNFTRHPRATPRASQPTSTVGHLNPRNARADQVAVPRYFNVWSVYYRTFCLAKWDECMANRNMGCDATLSENRRTFIGPCAPYDSYPR